MSKMEKNTPIEITQVANGFKVTPLTYSGEATNIEQVHVFQSMEELTYWINNHFTHRSNPTIRID